MNSAFIARMMVKQVFQGKGLLIVPETYWTGDECDLLVVMQDLRLIDVEIKISRADFKRDAAKDKWFHAWDWRTDGPWQPGSRGKPREWPRRVWKHYFAMPEAIWSPDLANAMPSPASGVILLRERNDVKSWRVERRATPNRDAEKISAADAIDIARLAGLRMWDALHDLEMERDRMKVLREERKAA